jgi:hypothetical protein
MYWAIEFQLLRLGKSGGRGLSIKKSVVAMMGGVCVRASMRSISPLPDEA